MIQYKVKITETSSNESITYWTYDFNIYTWKAMKRALLEQIERYGTEHELTLTRLTDKKNCHWLGAKDETIITRIRTGASNWERFLHIACNID